MTETCPRADITLDQQLALRSAAAHLSRDFEGTFGVETIERFLHSSYEQFAGRAAVANFLPLLAERFARQRLHALAKVEGLTHDGRPVVLFLCTHNAGRSQMAMGFFQHLAGDAAVAWSGGSEPGDEVNPAAIEAMRVRSSLASATKNGCSTTPTVRTRIRSRRSGMRSSAGFGRSSNSWPFRLVPDRTRRFLASARAAG